MKALIYVPLGLLLSAAAAGLVLRGMYGQVEVKTLATATAIVILASEAALVPLTLVRHGQTAEISQAALLGTMIHLFFTFALGAGAYLMKLVGRRDMFLMLLLALYWVSLLLVVTAMIRSVRRSAASVKTS